MADIGYDGQVAIITGSGGGLGREHALELARRGARIVVNDLGGSVSGEGHEEGPAHKTAKEINDLGGIAVADTNSVATPEGGAAIVKTAVDEFGTVDIVINNVGILRDKTFHNLTPELLNPVLDVHLRGAFYVTQPAYVIMREKGYGRIVNTSSNSGILGNFGQSNYAAAKMGLVGFTRVLANEGRKHNIKANAIAPVAKTRMTEELLGAVGDNSTPSSSPPSWPGWLLRGRRHRRDLLGGRWPRQPLLHRAHPGLLQPEPHGRGRPRPLDEIRDEDGYLVPDGPNDELRKIFETVTAAQG